MVWGGRGNTRSGEEENTRSAGVGVRSASSSAYLSGMAIREREEGMAHEECETAN